MSGANLQLASALGYLAVYLIIGITVCTAVHTFCLGILKCVTDSE